jgi:hypothetical protein
LRTNADIDDRKWPKFKQADPIYVITWAGEPSFRILEVIDLVLEISSLRAQMRIPGTLGWSVPGIG